MNNLYYNEFLKHFSNMRSLNSRIWFDEHYFVALYTFDDEFVTFFEDIKQAQEFFDINPCHLLSILRNSGYIDYQGKRYKLCLVEKDNDLEIMYSK